MWFSWRPSAVLSLLLLSVVLLEGDLDRIGILKPFWFALRGFVKDLG
jgi:hypothetical protein